MFQALTEWRVRVHVKARRRLRLLGMVMALHRGVVIRVRSVFEQWKHTVEIHYSIENRRPSTIITRKLATRALVQMLQCISARLQTNQYFSVWRESLSVTAPQI